MPSCNQRGVQTAFQSHASGIASQVVQREDAFGRGDVHRTCRVNVAMLAGYQLLEGWHSTLQVKTRSVWIPRQLVDSERAAIYALRLGAPASKTVSGGAAGTSAGTLWA
jgi:hypothetical protein